MTNSFEEISEEFREYNLDLLEPIFGILQDSKDKNLSEDKYNILLRTFHTIKGNAGIQNLNILSEFAHQIESKIINSKNENFGDFYEELLEDIKTISKMIYFATENFNENYNFKVNYDSKSQKTITKTSNSDKKSLFDATLLLEFELKEEFFKTGNDIFNYLQELEEIGNIEHIKIDKDRIPDLENIEPELSYIYIEALFFQEKISDIDEFIDSIKEIFEFLDEDEMLLNIEIIYLEELFKNKKQVKINNLSKLDDKKEFLDSIKNRTKNKVRVQQYKIDSIHSAINSTFLKTVEILNKNNSDYSNLESLKKDISNISSELEFISTSIFKTKTNSIHNLVTEFLNSWNSVTDEVQKEINLKFKYDESILVEQNVFLALKEVMLHIFRNSADHGIEEKIERNQKYKSTVGNIKTSIFWDSDFLNILIFDDGRGLDENKILNKALEKNLISQEQTTDFIKNKKKLFNLIFEENFSTKETSEINNISGRGFGMNIVKEKISELNGEITISSIKDRFTKFNILIPRTQILKNGILFKISNFYVLVSEQFIDSNQNLKNRDKSEYKNILKPYFENINYPNLVYLNCEKKLFLSYESKSEAGEYLINKMNILFQPIKIFDGMAILPNGKIMFSLSCFHSNFFC
jgi:two-component system chemotaxis sensor kinase CheA